MDPFKDNILGGKPVQPKTAFIFILVIVVGIISTNSITSCFRQRKADRAEAIAVEQRKQRRDKRLEAEAVALAAFKAMTPRQHFEAAQKALDLDDRVAARSHLSAMPPDDLDGKLLKIRIDKLPKIISDFETSEFYRTQYFISKDEPYDLHSGSQNNGFSFKDLENPYSSVGVELTTNNKQIIEIGIHWNGHSVSEPARISNLKTEQIRQLALFWGISGQTTEIVNYVKSQQNQRYRGGSDQAPWKKMGPITIKCGTTGETLWLSWK